MTYADGNPGTGKDMFDMLTKTCLTCWQRHVSRVGKDMFDMLAKTC